MRTTTHHTATHVSTNTGSRFQPRTVERAVPRKRKAALAAVHLHRRHAQVKQQPVQRRRRRQLGQAGGEVSEVAARKAELRARRRGRFTPRASQRVRSGVLVDANEERELRVRLEQRGRVAASAERAVHEAAEVAPSKERQHFRQQDRRVRLCRACRLLLQKYCCCAREDSAPTTHSTRWATEQQPTHQRPDLMHTAHDLTTSKFRELRKKSPKNKRGGGARRGFNLKFRERVKRSSDWARTRQAEP